MKDKIINYGIEFLPIWDKIGRYDRLRDNTSGFMDIITVPSALSYENKKIKSDEFNQNNLSWKFIARTKNTARRENSTLGGHEDMINDSNAKT